MSDRLLEYVRITLYVALAMLGFFLFQAWQTDHPVRSEESVKAQNSAETLPGRMNTVPSPVVATTAVTNVGPATTVEPIVAPIKGQLVTVTTDVMSADIDTLGGNVVSLKLLKYPASLGSAQPTTLFNTDTKTDYLAESGLLSHVGPDLSSGQAQYTADQSNYVLSSGQDKLTVVLHWKNDAGLQVQKTYTFYRNQYDIGLDYRIANQTASNWVGNLYLQLLRTNTPPENHNGIMNLTTYFGAAVSSPAKPFDKITFKSMQQAAFNQQITGGWAAMIQHYFVSAWIPNAASTFNYYSNVLPNGLYSIGMISQPITVPAGANLELHSKLYAGPAVTSRLKAAAPGLQLTIDYGWFWFISVVIFWMLKSIHDLIGNWGWSIVLVTIVIKILFYQLSAKSYRSMSVLKNLQPRIEELKKRYGDDKQKLTQATLELYRKEKVNPMSGCLPILVQIPVFIALYWVLVESVELRQAPFILWIHDLSQRDPYYVLAVLVGLSMFIQQRLNPPPADPMQAKMMMLMPVIFTVLFANFPAGLLLYWFVNNTLSFMQQWYVMRQLNTEPSRKKS